ncbi:hypothetical protein R3P38DRAFT_2472408, partial [Favolaschia claudopus]
WYDDGEGSDESDYAESISSAQELQELIDRASDEDVVRSRAENAELLDLTSAALALSADDIMQIHRLPDIDAVPEVLDEIIAEEQAAIELPALSVTEPSKPLGRGAPVPDNLDFDYLVDLRRRHQTIQAAVGVRTRVGDSADSEKAKERSLRQQLIRKFHLALKEEQDTATGTGLERAARWRASAPGGSEYYSLNFFDVCLATKLQAAAKRKTIFTKAGVPSLPEVIAARVTPLRPISIGDFGVIYTSRGLMVGHVFEMYSKGGGKYGKHEPVTESSNISALSKISVQVYEHGHGAQFRAIPTATAVVQTKQFAHIQPYQFICLLSGSPKTIPSGVELRLEDANRFKLLLRGSAKFEVAEKLFRKR